MNNGQWVVVNLPAELLSFLKEEVNVAIDFYEEQHKQCDTLKAKFEAVEKLESYKELSKLLETATPKATLPC